MSKIYEKMLKVCLPLALIVSIVLVLPISFASAAGDAHGEASFKDIIPYWINFSLYVLILWRLLSKPISRSWAARLNAIAEAVNKGERARDEATTALEDARMRRLGLPQDRKELEEEIYHSQEHESLEIINDGMERASRVTQQSQEMLKAEQKSFEAALRAELSQRVLNRAKEILSQKIDPQTDKKIRDNARQGLPELLN